MDLHGHQKETIGIVDIGNRLREIRSEHGLSIRALAEKSGLNVNTISLIENDKTSPSVSTLQQIAMALEIPISSFFETKTPKTSVVFQKENDRPHTRFSHGSMDNLSSNLARSDLESFIVTLAAKSTSGNNMIVHTGLELVYCLHGNLIYTIGDQSYQLQSGDSLFFEAHLPHRWRNAEDSAAQFLLILLRDEENDIPTNSHFH